MLVQNCYFEILPPQRYSFLAIATSKMILIKIKYCEMALMLWHFAAPDDLPGAEKGALPGCFLPRFLPVWLKGANFAP